MCVDTRNFQLAGEDDTRETRSADAWRVVHGVRLCFSHDVYHTALRVLLRQRIALQLSAACEVKAEV